MTEPNPYRPPESDADDYSKQTVSDGGAIFHPARIFLGLVCTTFFLLVVLTEMLSGQFDLSDVALVVMLGVGIVGLVRTYRRRH